ncbi:MAG: Crp/Fnr family transcriptional regulator [Acidobacteriales bacterium]|nr:Crp/Fnr family transcriptional regulator [Terriglobales bacterium]
MGVLRRFMSSDGCLDCTLRRDGDFCNLPHELLVPFSGMGHLTLYPPYVVLLTEGQAPRGVYIVCSGRAKLSVLAKDGKTVILQVAGERQVLGLSAVVSGRPSPIEATTIESCQIKFVERESFLNLLEHNSDAALECARLLSKEIGTAFRDVHVGRDFTHEEMAQMIGSSRETVTRLLSDMKRRELIRLEGSTLVIPNRVALQAIAA